eukprot:29197-Pelagococcus_subviridis.AAC.1
MVVRRSPPVLRSLRPRRLRSLLLPPSSRAAAAARPGGGGPSATASAATRAATFARVLATRRRI